MISALRVLAPLVYGGAAVAYSSLKEVLSLKEIAMLLSSVLGFGSIDLGILLAGVSLGALGSAKERPTTE